MPSSSSPDAHVGTASNPSVLDRFARLIGGREASEGSAQTNPAASPDANRASPAGFGRSSSFFLAPSADAESGAPFRRRNSAALGRGRRFLRRDTSGLFGDSGMWDGVSAGAGPPAWDAPGAGKRDTDSFDDEDDDWDRAEGLKRRRSVGAEALATPQVRSMRLIGKANPRYQWEQYFKTKEELAKMKKPIREYYERNNYLISQYLYIDRLLDSSMPHALLQEYDDGPTPDIPSTISEESSTSATPPHSNGGSAPAPQRFKRTSEDIFHSADTESTPLLPARSDEDAATTAKRARDLEAYLNNDEAVDSQSRIVSVAIAVNAAANLALLVAKIAVTAMTSSLSVLASLVDAALDFLSTGIVWATARMVARQDGTAYPVGRRPLEPLGVLVFAVVMMTAFTQVGVACIQTLTAPAPHSLVVLNAYSITIMLATVAIKGACWVWCRSVRNSAVQALAQDALTDVTFNSFSIFFPLVGAAIPAWWLDPLGGLLLAVMVIALWARTAAGHLRQLSGCAADRDTRAVLLYLTMRFAKTVEKITALRAWHAGDGVLVEVDVVLDARMALRDSHDVGESLQYVLESVPGVERAWVHADYKAGNLRGHVRDEV